MRTGGRNKFAIIALILFSVVFISGCIGSKDTPPPVPPKPSIDSVDSIVSVDWLNNNLGAENLRIIHVGGGYSKHIPGAVHVDTSDLMESPKKKGAAGIVVSKAKFEKLMGERGISDKDVIVVYGKTTGKWDAAWVARMWWVLKYYGHENVGFLDGGIEAWTKKGLPTTGDKPTITPTTYTAKNPDESLRATGDYVLANLNNPNVLILDDREADENAGKKKFGNDRGGRIPGSVFVNWREDMNPDGTLKSKAELKKIYEAAGVTPDKEIIIYCQGGVRVSHTLLVLKEILGYPNVKNYDGSWDEWANTKNPDGTYKYPLD